MTKETSRLFPVFVIGYLRVVYVRKLGVKLNSRFRKILKLVFGLPRKTADSFVVAFEDGEAFLIKNVR